MPEPVTQTSPLRQVNFRLPEELYCRLRLEAFDQNRSMNDLIVEILGEVLPS